MRLPQFIMSLFVISVGLSSVGCADLVGPNDAPTLPPPGLDEVAFIDIMTRSLSIYREDGVLLLRRDSLPGYAHHPIWSSDGTKIILSSEEGAPRGMVMYVLDLPGGSMEVLLEGWISTSPALLYSDRGEDQILFYGRKGDQSPYSLWRMPLSGGDPQLVQLIDLDWRYAQISPDARSIVWMQRGQLWISELAGGDAREVPIPDSLGLVSLVSWSPDSRWLAVSAMSKSTLTHPDIYRITTGGTRFSNLSRGALPGCQGPVISPDGKQIAFIVYEFGPFADPSKNGTYVMQADGSGMRRISDQTQWPSPAGSWSPDAEQIGFRVEGGFLMVNVDGSGSIEIRAPFNNYLWHPRT